MAQCCVKIQQPTKLWLTFSDLCTSSLHLWNQHHKRAPQAFVRKTHKSGHHLILNVPPCVDRVSGNFSQAPPWFSNMQFIHRSHAPSYKPCWLLIFHLEKSSQSIHSTKHMLLGFLSRYHTSLDAVMRHPCAELLLMSSNITEWRHHSTLVATQARPCHP